VALLVCEQLQKQVPHRRCAAIRNDIVGQAKCKNWLTILTRLTVSRSSTYKQTLASTKAACVSICIAQRDL
jgi:hypothetical protein